ncbi:MAG: hypothetical protein VR65_22585 [Desulfobulbaceae bacterium BRH_c16a]|nr:MAG: hypothetical protein VR65_22585 [Desulfobulbaceae bacterium BRH_c16a]
MFLKNLEIEHKQSPEIAVLIACSSKQLTKENIQTLSALLAKTLDWDVLLRSAQYHKVIPLLYKTLTTYFKMDVPERVFTDLSKLNWNNSVHSLNVSATLVNIIKLFNENGIDVLPIKGPLLAERLYGSCSMRMYGDLDILVRQKDLEKSLNVLQENNYRLVPEGIPQSTYMKFLKHKYHGQLLSKNGIFVEMHWELTGFYVSEPLTFERVEPFLIRTKFSNYPTLDLIDEMLLIFLCIHGNSHRLEKLDYICSVAELLKISPNIDWALIMEIGQKYKMTKRILVTLCLAKKIFGSAISVWIEDAISNNRAVAQRADRVMGQDFIENSEAFRHPLQRHIRYQYNVMDNKYDSIKYILRSIVVPNHNDWQKKRFSDVLFWFYFLYKPYRMLSVPVLNRMSTTIDDNLRKRKE